ncbi:hypothetical protein G6F46_006072 [Rhizopus delemar]|uniref:Uncharacterized protein n=2 Tax=Rhizopus TaxID=4842 RepID=A0A9P6Z4L9_9FUNG|nr:hypothetical protein G6F43_004363 [Rhizopus delemar]KAG1544361.1 hypothetical protein G6F51_006110 [Rhizopus arrhizus]KAG1463769.1 hypothetical protein G6F55_002193 [Rhizopus delemar]KAG1502684.1 hypothetical protein G6F54_002185 [Rhizopus delemar]KAG1511805.1 hypothetical protein G6F53_005660 [Rhizopus delemar]
MNSGNRASFDYNHRFSIVSEQETVQYLTAACIAHWAKDSPSTKATLTLDSGDTIDLPVYALRRRNAIVARSPDAPLCEITV